MMMHPAAVKTLKDVTARLVSGKKAEACKFIDWVSVKP
jgi:CO dehydrogenase/acetyl-CoA synthase delta subunit